MQRARDDVKYKGAGEYRTCHQSPPYKWTNLLEISSGDRATLSRGSKPQLISIAVEAHAEVDKSITKLYNIAYAAQQLLG